MKRHYGYYTTQFYWSIHLMRKHASFKVKLVYYLLFGLRLSAYPESMGTVRSETMLICNGNDGPVFRGTILTE